MNGNNGKLHHVLSPVAERDDIKAVMRACIERERQGSNAAMVKLMGEVAEEMGCTVLDIKVAMMAQSLVPLFKVLGV